MENYNSNPLVSIVVITYNSAKYVLETLESAKAQTYAHKELIISDDYSRDNTIEICRNWLADNNGYFVRSKIITAKINSGIPANCNRGIVESTGDWIKYIAGDDILKENCLQRFVEFINVNRKFNVVFSKVEMLKGEMRTGDSDKKIEKAKTIEEQRRFLLLGSGIKAPGSFIKKSVLEEVGLFEEKYQLIEDLPMWIKLNEHNILFGFLPDFLIEYRIHDESVYSSRKHFYFVNDKFNNSFSHFFYDILEGKLVEERLYFLVYKVKHNLFLDRLIFKTQNCCKLIALFFWLFKIGSLKIITIKIVNLVKKNFGLKREVILE